MPTLIVQPIASVMTLLRHTPNEGHHKLPQNVHRTSQEYCGDAIMTYINLSPLSVATHFAHKTPIFGALSGVGADSLS